MKSVFTSRRNKNPHTNEGKERKETPFFARESKTPFFNVANGGAVQAKLTVGQPGDKYEKEADHMADAVVNNSSKPAIQNKEISSIQRESLATPQEDEKLGTAEQRVEEDKLVQEKPEIQKMEAPEEEMVSKMEGEEEEIQKMEAPEEEEETVQKKEEEEEIQKKGEKEEEETVQTKSNTGSNQKASAGLSNTIKSKAGTGKKMSPPIKSEMESGFGRDFSTVNIHTDQDAVTMNKELGAQAFTHGKDIYFNSGKYNPDTTQGKRLLAHELTHVVQQKGLDEKIQRSCTPAEVTALNTEMHSYCDQPRRCNMQTDTCATSTAKVAAGNGCVSLRTLIQQKCFRPGDPGYHTHMQQIAQASAALKNCHGVQSAKCNEEDQEPRTDPYTVPESTFEKIKNFARRVIESGLDAEAAAEEFLRDNPGIAWTIIGLGVVGIIVLLADDLTLAGIADDVLIPVIATLIRVSWRFAF